MDPNWFSAWVKEGIVNSLTSYAHGLLDCPSKFGICCYRSYHHCLFYLLSLFCVI